MSQSIELTAEPAELASSAAQKVQVAISPRPVDGRLSYRDARQAPCLSCQTSPCCTYLLLQSVELNTLLDVDYITYLLNFDGIHVKIDRNGGVRVYLYQPCTYLDVPSGLCTVHETPLQPSICIHYNAHACWYRKSMTPEADSYDPVFDRRRMAWYAEHLSFDADRMVLGRPDWEEMLAAFGSMPFAPHAAATPPPDPMIEEWKSITLSAKGGDGNQPTIRPYTDPALTEPCQACDAYCCKTLVFPHGRPSNTSELDFFRYCLGFPSVEVDVADDAWAVVVRSTCRHLEGNRCSVFGTDQRPLKCGYYDAHKCHYRPYFGTPHPEKIVRIARDHFDVLAHSIPFDDVGRIMALPPIEVLRDILGNFERSQHGQLVPSNDD